MAAALGCDRILVGIFAHADDASLVRAAQVSQRWAAAATGRLWRDTSAIDFLPITPARRHIYAAKVCVLRRVSGDWFLPGGVFAALAFPRVDVVDGYLAGSVASLAALDARCPSLRSLASCLVSPCYMVDDGDVDFDTATAQNYSADDGYDGDDSNDDSCSDASYEWIHYGRSSIRAALLLSVR